MLVYADENAAAALRCEHQLNRDATLQLAKSLFSRDKLVPIGDGDLSCTCPPDDELHAGCFPGVSVVAAKEFGIDYPTKLPVSFVRGHGAVYLHAMHSAVDWFAFAKWNNGRLVRSLSLSPERGILEDVGERLPFEEPFWSGQHPAVDGEDEYPFQFHPLELGEAALKEFLGYQLEGPIDRSLLDPESVPLIKYKRSRSRWIFW
jgi:hypothetical protein